MKSRARQGEPMASIFITANVVGAVNYAHLREVG
jgi:hypothetical protein